MYGRRASTAEHRQELDRMNRPKPNRPIKSVQDGLRRLIAQYKQERRAVTDWQLREDYKECIDALIKTHWYINRTEMIKREGRARGIGPGVPSRIKTQSNRS